MANDAALQFLRAADPARELTPVPEEHRRLLRDQITAVTPPASSHARPHLRRTLQVLAAVVVALLIGIGAAWAAGAISPLSMFEDNPQQNGHGAATGSVWDQRVVPSSVIEADTVDLPGIGAVGFWYARALEGGWCGALRLPSGSWVGTGQDRADRGGTVPGCFPTREQTNEASGKPVYIINGFDYAEGDIDAGASGGSYWRIRYGKVTVPNATRVVDTVSGRGTSVVRGHLFLLAVPDDDPMDSDNAVHLVAYDAERKVVGDDCPSCSH